MQTVKFETVDEYIAALSIPAKTFAAQLRKIVQKAAPDAEEIISYNMPAYKYRGLLLYFAAHKNHIGFYPMTTGIKAVQKKLTNNKWAKGSVQFPYNEPLPVKLITEIIKFRVRENVQKAKTKLKKTDKK